MIFPSLHLGEELAPQPTSPYLQKRPVPWLPGGLGEGLVDVVIHLSESPLPSSSGRSEDLAGATPIGCSG